MKGCYPPVRRMDYGPECTRELVEEVAKRLATRTIRDSEFPPTSDADTDDFVAIVKDGSNRKLSFEDLSKLLDDWLALDAIRDKLYSLNIDYNTTEYWNNQIGFIPKAGEIVIYSDYYQIEVEGQLIDIPGIKIGSGNGYVQDLAFVGELDTGAIMEHIRNQAIHVSPSDRAAWDHKLDIDERNGEIVNETLIFIRDRL